MTRSTLILRLLPVVFLLQLTACSKDRSHIPPEGRGATSFKTRWYFERMRGYGVASAYLQFVSDSVLLEDGNNVPYRIVGDSLITMYNDGPFVQSMTATKDTLILRGELCTQYYSHHAPEWFSPRFAAKVLGVWRQNPNDTAATVQVDEGLITYPNPVYSVRAELQDRILTRYEREGLRRDTIDAVSGDVWSGRSAHGTFKLHRK